MTVTLIGCGTTSTVTTRTTSTNTATENDTPEADEAVSQMIGNYEVILDREFMAAGAVATVTVTPPDSTSYTSTFKMSSATNVTVNGGISTKSISLSSGGAGIKTYTVKGTMSGQVIAVTVEIAGQSEKAEFEIMIE